MLQALCAGPAQSASLGPSRAQIHARPVGHSTPGVRESILYAFQGGSRDGASPVAPLISDATGALYGTTTDGGARDSGTVFKLTPAGSGFTESILHAFRGGDFDGAYPVAGLLGNSAGTLFGTTSGGGSRKCVRQLRLPGCGVVFALTPSGREYKESVLYAFLGGSDGAEPLAGLIEDSNGVLYGTTYQSDEIATAGTVFTLTPAGSAYHENVIFGFPYLYSEPFYPDGSYPAAPVISDSSGAFYGTTQFGGGASSCLIEFQECGVAYKLTPSPGGYTAGTLHEFGNAGDGVNPVAGLVADGAGALYGTTQYGGASNLGTVFKLTPNGATYIESILYAFQGGADGALPVASLVLEGGSLYGTTASGGPANVGTVFSLTPSGSSYTESVLYAFKGGKNDGADPEAALIVDGLGNLYGTTARGGAADAGTVFTLAL